MEKMRRGEWEIGSEGMRSEWWGVSNNIRVPLMVICKNLPWSAGDKKKEPVAPGTILKLKSCFIKWPVIWYLCEKSVSCEVYNFNLVFTGFSGDSFRPDWYFISKNWYSSAELFPFTYPGKRWSKTSWSWSERSINYRPAFKFEKIPFQEIWEDDL